MYQGPNSIERQCTKSPTLPLVSGVYPELSLPFPEMHELHRYLGYSRGGVPSPAVAQRVEIALAELLPHLAPRGTYGVYSVTQRTPGCMHLGGRALTGSISEFLASADRVAVFILTVGEAVSQLAAEAWRKGDSLGALMIDAIGSWAAEATADALMKRIRAQLRDDEDLTLRYSPGYCGMEIAQQQALFELANAKAVGVHLMPSLLMRPMKSISGIVGLGPKGEVAAHRAPCDYCGQVGCHMRR